MAGINQKILQKRLFDFSNLLGGASQQVVLAKAVPIHMWREVQLLARFHDRNGTTWTSGQQVTVSLLAEAFTSEDPNADFLLPTALASVTFASTSSPPALFMDVGTFSGTGNLGGYARVVLTATQAGVAAPFQGNFSIDLALKG